MPRKAKALERRLNLDQDTPRLEIPLDDRWIVAPASDEGQPQFEDYREHEKRRAGAGCPKAVLWTGCSLGLLVVAMWALMSI